MEISTERVKELREQSGAGVMDCRNSLIKAAGDMAKALELLKEQSLVRAEKKINREVRQGLVEAYIHTGGRIGAMIEVNCETDFVARTDEFKELCHHLAMQVAAIPPEFISAEEIPAGVEVDPKVACLLLQPDIKDPAKTVQQLITEVIAKTGENIKVRRFARFELGV